MTKKTDAFDFQNPENKGEWLIRLSAALIFLLFAVVSALAAIKKLWIPTLPNFWVLPVAVLISVLGCGFLIYRNGKAIIVLCKSWVVAVFYAIAAYYISSRCHAEVSNFLQERIAVPPSALGHVIPYIIFLVMPVYLFVAAYLVAGIVYLGQFSFVLFVGSTSPGERNIKFKREVAIGISLATLCFYIIPKSASSYSSYVSDDSIVEAVVERGYVKAESVCKDVTPEQRVLFLDTNTISIASKDSESKWRFRVGACERM